MRIDYRKATSGITVDLGLSSNQITKDGDGGTDSFTNAKGGTIEIGGSLFADNLTGSANGDRFRPYGGDDVIDGKGGTDLVRYDRVEVANLAVDLATGKATGTFDARPSAIP